MIPPELVMLWHIVRSTDRNTPHEDEQRDTVAIGTHVCACVCVRERHANTYTEANRTK